MVHWLIISCGKKIWMEYSVLKRWTKCFTCWTSSCYHGSADIVSYPVLIWRWFSAMGAWCGITTCAQAAVKKRRGGNAKNVLLWSKTGWCLRRFSFVLIESEIFLMFSSSCNCKSTSPRWSHSEATVDSWWIHVGPPWTHHESTAVSPPWTHRESTCIHGVQVFGEASVKSLLPRLIRPFWATFVQPLAIPGVPTVYGRFKSSVDSRGSTWVHGWFEVAEVAPKWLSKRCSEGSNQVE